MTRPNEDMDTDSTGMEPSGFRVTVSGDRNGEYDGPCYDEIRSRYSEAVSLADEMAEEIVDMEAEAGRTGTVIHDDWASESNMYCIRIERPNLSDLFIAVDTE